MTKALVAALVALAVFFGIYGLAVRTEVGQHADEAALIGGRSAPERAQSGASRLLRFISVGSLVAAVLALGALAWLWRRPWLIVLPAAIVGLSLLATEAFKLVIMAALLHDVGHGPFSHSFEQVLSDSDWAPRHEDWTKTMISHQDSDIRERLEEHYIDSEIVASVFNKTCPCLLAQPFQEIVQLDDLRPVGVFGPRRLAMQGRDRRLRRERTRAGAKRLLHQRQRLGDLPLVPPPAILIIENN